MSKNISYRSSQLLNALIEQRKEFFTLADAINLFQGKDNSTVRKLLSDMTKRGLIMRIKAGLYHRIPYEQKPEQYFPNWHLTAEAMVKPKEYYIGFYSALDIHGLITQPSMVEQVVIHEQIKPKNHKVKNVRFDFITLNNNLFFGHKQQWIDNYNKVNCSDLEKTIIDCMYKPDYAGGIAEITKALYKIREKIQPAKFCDYLEKFDKQVVYKRLGFISDQLGLLPELQNFIFSKITESYAPLDPSMGKRGRYISKWRILDNMDFKTIHDYIKT